MPWKISRERNKNHLKPSLKVHSIWLRNVQEHWGTFCSFCFMELQQVFRCWQQNLHILWRYYNCLSCSNSLERAWGPDLALICPSDSICLGGTEEERKIKVDKGIREGKPAMLLNCNWTEQNSTARRRAIRFGAGVSRDLLQDLAVSFVLHWSELSTQLQGRFAISMNRLHTEHKHTSRVFSTEQTI